MENNNRHAPAEKNTPAAEGKTAFDWWHAVWHSPPDHSEAVRAFSKYYAAAADTETSSEKEE